MQPKSQAGPRKQAAALRAPCPPPPHPLGRSPAAAATTHVHKVVALRLFVVQGAELVHAVPRELDQAGVVGHGRIHHIPARSGMVGAAQHSASPAIPAPAEIPSTPEAIPRKRSPPNPEDSTAICLQGATEKKSTPALRATSAAPSRATSPIVPPPHHCTLAGAAPKKASRVSTRLAKLRRLGSMQNTWMSPADCCCAGETCTHIHGPISACAWRGPIPWRSFTFLLIACG